jgi:hypothetical protein
MQPQSGRVSVRFRLIYNGVTTWDVDEDQNYPLLYVEAYLAESNPLDLEWVSGIRERVRITG